MFKPQSASFTIVIHSYALKEDIFYTTSVNINDKIEWNECLKYVV